VAGPKAEISSLTVVLSGRWNQGGPSAKAAGREPMRAGRIRTSRIAVLEPATQHIELDLAE
jgi:hypothetical protein